MQPRAKVVKGWGNGNDFVGQMSKAQRVSAFLPCRGEKTHGQDRLWAVTQTAKVLKGSIYIYIRILNAGKSFNLSAALRKSLNISAKQAEGFDFQIFQQGSDSAVHIRANPGG